MVNPRTQWAALGPAVVLTAVLWPVPGGRQWWFPGLWFAALALVGPARALTMRSAEGP